MSTKRPHQTTVNPLALPKISYLVVNVGVGKNRDNKSYLEAVQNNLAQITGQRPQVKKAKKSVAGFNVRQGNLIGFKVSLRGQRKEDFIRRFVNITLPRVRDFRGLSVSSLDGHGNLNVGLEEQLAFPEINPDKTDVVFGVQVTFITTAKDDAAGLKLFKAHGFPLLAQTTKN